MSTYLVGGAVRDWLLGRTPYEYDYVFDESIDTFVQRNPTACKVGRTVNVFLLDNAEYMPLRGASLAEDMLSRDVTVNAMALDIQGILHTHPLALHDLRACILRPCSNHTLFDDPARVFRLARLACYLPEFTIHDSAIEQMRAVAQSGILAALPVERVSRECVKALHAPKPSRWLRVLQVGQCLEPWFSELTHADSIPAGPLPYHHESVLEHLMAVMDAVAGDPLAVWMALCHDVGKTTTKTALLPHHYAHESRGVPLVNNLAERLRMPNIYRAAGTLITKLHMKAGRYELLRRGTRCDVLLAVHKAGFSTPFWRVVEADSAKSLYPQVQEDLSTVLKVSLPEKWRNKGPLSGEHLRRLQCQALRQRK